MESRACGGCGGGGFLTLSTTSEDEKDQLQRLAYLRVVKDVPPMPLVGGGAEGGELTLQFYELWNEPLREVFGGDPTLEDLQAAARAGTLRMSKIIRSPSGIIRARIYNTETAAFEPIGDEACDGWPHLHKNFYVRELSQPLPKIK